MNDNYKTFLSEIAQIENQIETEYVDSREVQMAWPFIDGVFNPQLYWNAPRKVMWILKEPYDGIDEGVAYGGGGHMNNIIADKTNYSLVKKFRRTWFPIVYITYGIKNSIWAYDDLEDIPKSWDMCDVLEEIAMINISKMPGLTKTPFKKIRNAYSTHKTLLLKQLTAYQPDVIIGCGNTMGLFNPDLGITQGDLVHSENCYYAIKNNKMYLSAYHPSQHSISREEYVSEILGLVKRFYEP